MSPCYVRTCLRMLAAMLLAILQNLTEGKKVEGRCTGKLNLIPGCDFNTGDYREYKRILTAFGIEHELAVPPQESLLPGRTQAKDARRSVPLHREGEDLLQDSGKVPRIGVDEARVLDGVAERGVLRPRTGTGEGRERHGDDNKKMI